MHKFWTKLCLILTCVHEGLQLSPLVPSDVAVSLEDIVDEAVNLYYDNNYENAIKLFEKALINHKMLQHIESTCIAKCKKSNISKELEMDFGGHAGLYHFGNLIAQANCIKLCKEEHPYGLANVAVPRMDILEDFEIKKPYNFLQFSYYQLNHIKKACQAAKTFYQANPESGEAFNNMQYYRSLSTANESECKSLEEPKFVGLFFDGATAYENNDHEVAVAKIERSLEEYFATFEDCQHLCYKPTELEYFDDLHTAVTRQLVTMLRCAAKCEEKLNPVLSDGPMQNFVSKCFAYLQYSYYSLGNWGMAVPAAASVLLLQPDDETAERNMEYYKKQEGKHGLTYAIHFQPRTDAIRFNDHLRKLERLIKTGESTFDTNDEDEVKAHTDITDAIFSTLTDKVTGKIEEMLRGEFGNS